MVDWMLLRVLQTPWRAVLQKAVLAGESQRLTTRLLWWTTERSKPSSGITTSFPVNDQQVCFCSFFAFTKWKFWAVQALLASRVNCESTGKITVILGRLWCQDALTLICKEKKETISSNITTVGSFPWLYWSYWEATIIRTSSQLLFGHEIVG